MPNLILENSSEGPEVKIIVVGVGGAGGNAVNRMIEAGLKGVRFISINTDIQALTDAKAETKLQIGNDGMGVGGDPGRGREAAEHSRDDIKKFIDGAHMLFITGGMGGGTGTGAAPVIGEIARDLGILTVGVVSKPFAFEGSQRMANAEAGIEALTEVVDSLIIVPNEKLKNLADNGEAKLSVVDCFKMADDVLRQGVQSVAQVVTERGMINTDFNDVRKIMQNRGVVHMGIGRGTGENKVDEAIDGAINSPLLETSIDGASAVLLNISAGPELTMFEYEEVGNKVKERAADNLELIAGFYQSPDLADELVVTVVATGFPGDSFNDKSKKSPKPDLNHEQALGFDSGFAGGGFGGGFGGVRPGAMAPAGGAGKAQVNPAVVPKPGGEINKPNMSGGNHQPVEDLDELFGVSAGPSSGAPAEPKDIFGSVPGFLGKEE